jgi:ABC-type nitrate/sulfonate/bicarbonate transport system substrate-binding protein
MRTPPSVLVALFAVVALVVMACGPAAAPTATPAAPGTPDPATTPAPPGETPTPEPVADVCDLDIDQPIQVGFASVTQPAYLPALLAIDTSEEIPMEAVFFQQSELAMQALLQGEVEVLAIGVNGPMITISEGAELRMFAVTIGNDWTIVATQDIQTVQDLDGAAIGIHSETSTGTPLARGTLDEHGLDAEFITIPGSPNRAQAMTQGQIDATTLFLSDSIRLEREAPERFHVLLDYAEVPFASQSLVASTDWLDSDQQRAECFAAQFVSTGQRMSDDPQWAIDELIALFPDEDPEYLEALATEYIGRGLWVTDGGSQLFSNFSQAIQINIDLGTLRSDASTDASDYLRTDILDAALQLAGE